MRKKYNMFIISRLYLKSFYKFLVEKTNIRSSKESYNLFMYSIKKLYDLETVEYSESINKYGKDCIKYLSNTSGTPNNKENISYEDRVRLVSVCEGYVQATGLLTYNTIKNGRIKEG